MARRRSVLGVGSRWASPSRRQRGALLVTSSIVISLGVWIGWELLGSAPAPATMADAYDLLGEPLRLESAQDEAWRFSVRDGGGLVSQTDALLSPLLPPPICGRLVAFDSDSGADPGSDGLAALNRSIRVGERAFASGDRVALGVALDSLRNTGAALSGEAAVVAQYAVARSLAAGDELGAAARLLEGVALAGSDGGGVPIVAANTAARMARSNDDLADQVVLAFHLRYLAGLVAHRRARPEEAIGHFRRALNAVNYLVRPARTGQLGRGGHYERLVVSLEGFSCGSGVGQELTSLDAYAGLVAAYMKAPDFRDPTRLAREVSRRGFEIDPNDPLTPLLAHAQEVADERRASPIPEHVFWASSNLQRVYHYNRLRPDPRLAVTRAVLTLRVLDDRAWTDALDLTADESCDMLAEVASGLHRDAASRGDPVGPPGSADSAWAAVAVHTFARVEDQCPDRDVARADPQVRGQWLQLGGELLHSGLVARYEGWRRALEGQSGVAPAETAEAVFERVDGDRRFFTRGRVPPDLSVAIDPQMGREFVESWRRAIFSDVANQLIESVEQGRAQGRIRSADVGRYVRAVEGAVSHAGLRPVDAYRPEALDVLTRSQGTVSLWAQRVRYHARSNRTAVAGLLALATTGLLGLVVLGFVGWWRFTLLTRRDFYAEEQRARHPVAAVTPEGPIT